MSVGHIKDRIVEVAVVVPFTLMVSADVVEAAHADSPSKNVGVATQSIHGVIGTHTGTGGGDCDRTATVVMDERYEFPQDVSIVEFLAPNPLPGMNVVVEPTVVVDGVAAHDFHSSGLDVTSQSVNHSEPL